MKFCCRRIAFVALLLSIGVNGSHAQTADILIDADFPGGNIIVDDVAAQSTVYYKVGGSPALINVRPDLRDTRGDWFYWYFRISGAEGKAIKFQFPRRKISAFGPAYSLDHGKSWKWLYDKPQQNDSSFSYTFTDRDKDVLFSMGIPYLHADFEAFIRSYESHPYLSVSSLTTSNKGRNVVRVLIHNPKAVAKHKIVITARHHACEMMASYVLEGLISRLMSDSREMKWLLDNTEFFIVPFMDVDGVEDGDQGKQRMPRDHWLDYSGESIFRSTAALREQIPAWSEGKLRIAMDLHCPSIVGKDHEYIHLVGEPDKDVASEQAEFARRLEAQDGELDFSAKSILPWGIGWNVSSNYKLGESFSTWMSKTEGLKLATTLEFPYSNSDGKKVTPENSRAFGADVAGALFEYLQGAK